MSKTKRRGPTIKPRETYIDARELERIKNEAVKDAMLSCLELIFAIPMKVMREHYGWGARKRLPALADLLAQELETLNRDDMDPAKYIQNAEAICGIKIDVKIDVKPGSK